MIFSFYCSTDDKISVSKNWNDTCKIGNVHQSTEKNRKTNKINSNFFSFIEQFKTLIKTASYLPQIKFNRSRSTLMPKTVYFKIRHSLSLGSIVSFLFRLRLYIRVVFIFGSNSMYHTICLFFFFVWCLSFISPTSRPSTRDVIRCTRASSSNIDSYSCLFVYFFVVCRGV